MKRGFAGVVLFAALVAETQAENASPDAAIPVLPGLAYIRTADGCGLLAPGNSEQAIAAAQEEAKRAWIGDCRHGLVDGRGYWLDSDNNIIQTQYAAFALGEPLLMRAGIEPSYLMGDLVVGGAAQVTYTLLGEGENLFNATIAMVPMPWSPSDPYRVLVNSDNGSGFDDHHFSLQSGPMTGGAHSIDFMLDHRSCLIAGKSLSGCRALSNEFSVYGVAMSETEAVGTTEARDTFVLCPDPQNSKSCESMWRNTVGKHLDTITRHINEVVRVMQAEDNQLKLAQARREAELPLSWKQHWAKWQPSRPAVELAQKCQQLTDFHALDIADALRIKQKYSAPPCNAALTAANALRNAEWFISADTRGKRDEQEIRQAYADAAEDIRRSNANAWQGFFQNFSSMLQSHTQIMQARIDTENARLAAQQQTAGNSAPLQYQAYSSPGDPETPGPRTEERPLHRPELDRGHCVRIVQTGSGGQVIANDCGETVEAFWCNIATECPRGYGGGSVTLGTTVTSYPIPPGEVHYGACKGANSGGLVKDNGVNRGRYACTGP